MKTLARFETLSEQVENTINLVRKKFDHNEDYLRFEEAYAEMQKLGLIKKQEYNIPLVDSIGRKRYNELKTSSYQLENQKIKLK